MQNISSFDKIRIIALYVIVKNGISEENLNKLFTHAQINLRDQYMVRNLSFLGINVVTDVSFCSRLLLIALVKLSLIFSIFAG